MNVWTKIHELFAATPPREKPNVVWHDEMDALRKLRAQRIALAAKPTHTAPKLIALPVREM